MKNITFPKTLILAVFAFIFVIPVVSEAVPPSVSSSPPPAPTPTPTGPSSDGGSKPGSRRRDISSLISTGGGEVLGAATCKPYLNEYIKLGANNNTEEVKKLQMFLNEFMGANLEITGIYDEYAFDWVKKFQSLHALAILTPWTNAGFPTGPTGYVYKTTKHWINLMKCPELVTSTPLPILP